MTKLRQVLKFVRSTKREFRWKDFNTRFKNSQTCLTYLCYLVNAGYVVKIRRGWYQTLAAPSLNLQHDILYEEAYGPRHAGRNYDPVKHFEGGPND